MRLLVCSGLGNVWGSFRPDVLDTPGQALGGGEAAMLRTSFGMAERGHEVEAFVPLKGDVTTHRSVTFRHLRDAYDALLTGRYDALLSWSDKDAIRLCPLGTKAIFVQQLNDLPDDILFWRKVDVIVPASASHGRYLMSSQPKEALCGWVPLYGGVLPHLYERALPWHLRKPVVSWWSSPDRGLHHLLLMWPTIREHVPNAELRIAYHMERYINDTREAFLYGEMAWRARALEQAAEAAKRAGGVKVLGPISRVELAAHQRETKVWAFPFEPVTPTEGLSVSMGESIACGAWPIARPADALPEVYGDCVQWVDATICDDAWRARFAKAVIDALKSEKNPYAWKGKRFATEFTWEAATRNLERACQMASSEAVLVKGGM